MLWFVVSTLVHILISSVLLVSWTVPHSWPSLDLGGSHQLTYGLCLCLFLSLLVTFEVTFSHVKNVYNKWSDSQVIVLHAIHIIWKERKRLQASDHNTCSLLDSLG